WVEIGISSADTAQNRDIRFHLVGSLRAAGSVQTGTCRPYSKGETGQPAEYPVDLPVPDDLAGQAGVGIFLTSSERERVDSVDLEVVRAVETGGRAVAAPQGRIVPGEPGVVVIGEG